MLVLDVECYKDYFLVCFLNEKGQVASYEMYDGKKLNTKKLAERMQGYLTVGFNSNSYDLLMIAAALEGMTCAELKELSDEIITIGKPSWAIVRDECLKIDPNWEHIDIINVIPGQASLKIYGARIGMPRLQELPFPPEASIRPADREIIRKYCVNDLRVTEALLHSVEKQLTLRKTMGEEYGLDLMSKSDAQIAEAVLRSEVYNIKETMIRPSVFKEGTTFKYRVPDRISFKRPELRDLLVRLAETEFTTSKNGSVELPQWLKDTHIKIGKGVYRMGIGGLHSSEKAQSVEAGTTHVLTELDVASYYPSIILDQGVEPLNMLDLFIPIYKKIVDRRIAAKRSGDKVTADTLKIVINGSFGKLGSKYSALYAPNLLIQTTITGQLALLMLIESMEDNGLEVVSANTDGVVVFAPKEEDDLLSYVASDWELDTTYQLERSDYRSLHSRDVNNYIAVKYDGSTKRKGVFAQAGLMKNPQFPIVSDAIAAHLSGEKDYKDVIFNSMDIQKFVMVRTVNGGAVWRGEPLGKAVRFYYSTDVGADEAIHYVTNGNKVPQSDGAIPCLDLPEKMPDDVDRERYVGMAMIAMKGMGYA